MKKSDPAKPTVMPLIVYWVKKVPRRFLEVQKKGFLQRMFGGKE